MGSKRALLLAATLAIAGCGGGSSGNFQLEEASVASVASALREGRATCRSITEQSLARIEALNHAGPALRAVLETNPDALALADALDAAYVRGGPAGPLHCVPLLVKDNFHTGDRMATTAGSLTVDGFRAATDAFSVARLRIAGALPIAKTNMDEWASGAFGYSSRGGQTLNAHKLDRIPGGSSGGSAVGVAAGMGVIATGSDTGGSIRIPAAVNGVVGIKPTMGLVGRTGVIPSSSELDVAGPIARTVEDAAWMLGVMAGVDPGDPASSASGRPAQVDYTASLDANGLSGARLGVLTSFTGQALAAANEEFDAAFGEALATMAGRGATLRQGLSVPPVGSDEETIGALTTLAVGRFSEEFAGYFAAYPHQGIQSFDDVLARARALGPGVVKNLASLEASVASPASAHSWADAHALRSRMIAAALKTMDDAQVDALIFLTLSCPATPLPGVVDPGFKCKGAPAMPYKFGQAFGGEGILLASMTGLPEVTVPAGFTADGVPIALSFFGRPFSEATLIKLAYAYQQASRKRRAPRFLR